MKKKRNTNISFAIVGEGITEWMYFDYIRKTRKFFFTLKPDLPKHADYKTIFRRAKSLKGQAYDFIFCVLDTDKIVDDREIQAFQTACRKLPKGIIPITSFPCIEIWFLMHFVSSPPSQVLESYTALSGILHKFIPDYEKSRKYFMRSNVFHKMEEDNGLKRAVMNAEKILPRIFEQQEPGQTPYTEISSIIKQLKKCKECTLLKDCMKCVYDTPYVFLKNTSL